MGEERPILRVVRGGCPQCRENVVCIEKEWKLQCEECSWKWKAPNKNTWRRNLNLSVPYGPKELRHKLTLAGQQAVEDFLEDRVPDSAEMDDAYQAYKGLLTDEETLKNLREGGFIL